jgi:hypothetical protein
MVDGREAMKPADDDSPMPFLGYADLRSIRIKRLPGFVDGDRVYAWCGHRWNQYGVLLGDMLRYSHCAACDEEGVSHYIVLGRSLPGSVLRGLRRRYLGQWEKDRTLAWRRRQAEFVLSISWLPGLRCLRRQ